MKRAHGFTLIEVGIVIIIMALLSSGFLVAIASVTQQVKRKESSARLAIVETALTAYVSQGRRLPCPANGTMVVGTHADAGLEQRNGATGDCTGNQQHGVVPWRTIGLSEADILDGFNNRLTYRVAIGLTRDNALNLTRCDPAGGGPAVGTAPNQSCEATTCASTVLGICTPPQAVALNRGIRINDSAGTAIADPAGVPVATGAAFVVISHGENGAGAYSPSGVLQAGLLPAGTAETSNYANLAYTAGSALVEGQPNFTETNARFDDVMVRPTIIVLATKAGVGPRTQP